MDMLGFLIAVVATLTYRQQLRRALLRFRHFVHEQRVVLRGYYATAMSYFSTWLVLLALLLALLQILLTAGWYWVAGWHWSMLVFVPALTVGQVLFAYWNRAFGRLNSRPDTHPGAAAGNRRTGLVNGWADAMSQNWLTAHPENDLVDYVTSRSRPLVWFVLVPALFYAQFQIWEIWCLDVPSLDLGIKISGHGYMFHQRQLLDALAFISLCVPAVFAFVTQAALAWAVVNGVRTLEWLTTKATQVGLAVGPFIEWADTLREMGGAVDIVDEGFVSTVISLAIMSPVSLFVLSRTGVFLLPHYIVWFVLTAVTVISAVLALNYAHSGDEERHDVGTDSRVARQLAYKAGLPLILVILPSEFVLMYLREDLFNAWYGVTFYAYRAWWIYLLVMLAAPAAVWIFSKLFKKLWGVWPEASVWRRPLNWTALGLLGLAVVSALVGIFSLCCMVQDIRGRFQTERKIVSARLDAAQVLGSVGYEKQPLVEVMGNQTRVSFRTKHPARGILEFIHPQQALDAGMPPYLVLGPELEDQGNCGDGKQSCDLYRHTVAFESGRYAGPFRIIMRNADERDARLFGKVEAFSFASDAPVPVLKDEKKQHKGKDALAAEASSSDEPVPSPGQPGGRVAQTKPCPTLLPIPGFR